MSINLSLSLIQVKVDMIQGKEIPRFANYIQDHMVLQRASQRAIVWGYGDPTTLTTLTLNHQIHHTISESQIINPLRPTHRRS